MKWKKNYLKKKRQFDALKSDVERWQWIRKHRNKHLVVYISPNDAYAMFRGDKSRQIFQLRYPIPCNSGSIHTLFTAFGIESVPD